MDPIPQTLQLYSIRRALDKSKSLRLEYDRLTGKDTPRIIRRLARQRIEDGLQIMEDVGFLSPLEHRAAVVHVERALVHFYPEYRDW